MRRGRPGGTGPHTQFGHWATVPSDRTCCRRRAEGWGGHTRQRGAAATGGRPYLHSPACPSPVRPLEARCGGCVGVQAGVSMQGPAAMSSVAACLHSPACPSHVRPLEARCGGCVGVKAGPGSRPVRRRGVLDGGHPAAECAGVATPCVFHGEVACQAHDVVLDNCARFAQLRSLRNHVRRFHSIPP